MKNADTKLGPFSTMENVLEWAKIVRIILREN
jgi:hypothetical protein